MKLPKVTDKPASHGFGIANILGLIFLIIGILLIVVLTGIKLPIDLSGTENILEYGAAIGSILGGISMLFKKHESVPEMKIK
ncbi:MAG: hypothetical protein AABX74_06065 [Nanoarchaeota archaeon]